MVLEEYPQFLECLRAILADRPVSPQRLEELFQRFTFALVDRELRNKKRRCRVPNYCLVTWPARTTREELIPMGQWVCSSMEFSHTSLEWCPLLNTLIWHQVDFNEGGYGYHLRGIVTPFHRVSYRLLTVEETMEILLTSPTEVIVPAG